MTTPPQQQQPLETQGEGPFWAREEGEGVTALGSMTGPNGTWKVDLYHMIILVSGQHFFGAKYDDSKSGIDWRGMNANFYPATHMEALRRAKAMNLLPLTPLEEMTRERDQLRAWQESSRSCLSHIVWRFSDDNPTLKSLIGDEALERVRAHFEYSISEAQGLIAETGEKGGE